MHQSFEQRIIDSILLYYIIHYPNLTFKNFADRAYIRGTETLAFGEIATPERRRHTFRVRDLKIKLARRNPSSLPPSDFSFEVLLVFCCVSYSLLHLRFLIVVSSRITSQCPLPMMTPQYRRLSQCLPE